MARIGQILLIFVLNLFFCECDNLILDLSPSASSEGTQRINIKIYYIDGLACRKFNPTLKNRITKVVDGSREIWKGGAAECTGAILYPETGQGKLLHLFLEKGKSAEHKYYSRDGDLWKEINPVTYRTLMDEFTPKETQARDPAKATGKKKAGSYSVPSLLCTIIIPALVFTHVH
ncbi:conserved hypothetical protein [Theileria orientalis strain Shintoku]|uniref:Signal peptide containing protein n=1 Tax=Theileria orientalis strain Shintoku TaxID=869250 RepID=J4C7V6_THEOR|nr:conserved hypothetical protein [Theileria orientalis strain Shintoku]PVC52473.1 hypothetical protein MACL_00000739 [Theileria orientalis]BAM39703.1 conserved hypothetical protein [Theileria orientalis strain Shintoku]|eukprot:XP_009690004.1 conserved hypothetical protein [Theileria orientalis strain Shintoku]